MQHKLFHFHAHAYTWHYAWAEILLSVFLVVFIVALPASAAMRFQERSLYVVNNEPGETSDYIVSFRYMSSAAIGSVELLFCMDPIPYHPCVTPPGMNASGAVLSEQQGETGFSVLSRSANRIVLTRPPAPISSTTPSAYTFQNIVNSTVSSEAFAIRLKSHATTNASGPQVDFGSVRSQIAQGITIETQVPPMLIFCLAEEVSENCTDTNDNYYTDMGELTANSTLTAQSQMAIGTNASGGFAITANGTPMAAGTNVIDSPTTPTESRPGTNQFGINLVENTTPSVGGDPEGTWANALPSPDYGVPNRYKYVPGDVVAYSPNVSLMKKFTVSYIVNSRDDLRAGVYTTTITYVASGRF